MISFDQIEKTAHLIAQEFQPEKIILFGSYARGTPSARGKSFAGTRRAVIGLLRTKPGLR